MGRFFGGKVRAPGAANPPADILARWYPTVGGSSPKANLGMRRIVSMEKRLTNAGERAMIYSCLDFRSED